MIAETCWSCVCGLHEECFDLQPIEDSDNYKCCCFDGSHGKDSEDWVREVGRPVAKPDEITDVLSTGRKRAAMLRLLAVISTKSHLRRVVVVSTRKVTCITGPIRTRWLTSRVTLTGSAPTVTTAGTPLMTSSTASDLCVKMARLMALSRSCPCRSTNGQLTTQKLWRPKKNLKKMRNIGQQRINDGTLSLLSITIAPLGGALRPLSVRPHLP